MVNRFRALLTWGCLAGSKIAGLSAPIFLARATDAVASSINRGVGNPFVPYPVFVALASYVGLLLVSRALGELQSLLYINVKQAAYVEISVKTFAHLHDLSL